MEQASNDNELARLLGISHSFKTSKTLNLSAKLGIYTLLHEHPGGLSWKDIADRIALKKKDAFRGVSDFLDLLVSIRTLERHGNDPNTARYTKHPTAAAFLVQTSEDYCGGVMKLNNDRSYALLECLEDSLKTGEVPPDTSERIPNILTVFGAQGTQQAAERSCPSVSQHFSEAMMGASIGNFRKLAKVFPFSKYQSLGDFGGSNGRVSQCLRVFGAPAECTIVATTYDLPLVVKGAKPSYV
ncbi:hypothetical protein CEUSTIGMA_g4421.t1 [Chlamydomonas eustigma]|uniref:O-methyltransferase dimerisation domain-containing protein n=1 Tax=Chlamydomonas eustigma TaxID=1157962 RepID=A0A250X1J9_9CHLO|nr:hypothetical protein CEUSTIGMA_g4421.t1 [Chlamydomonas eustigma]|eukprot:GAX76974.1 hypothetical protein CEUSTIGMA_g4421.t1 [Chlamydomonas eustigma]